MAAGAPPFASRNHARLILRILTNDLHFDSVQTGVAWEQDGLAGLIRGILRTEPAKRLTLPQVRRSAWCRVGEKQEEPGSCDAGGAGGASNVRQRAFALRYPSLWSRFKTKSMGAAFGAGCIATTRAPRMGAYACSSAHASCRKNESGSFSNQFTTGTTGQ